MAAGLFFVHEIGNKPVSAFQLNRESLGISQMPSLSLAQVGSSLDDIIGNAIEDIDYIIERGYQGGEVIAVPSEANPNEEILVELDEKQLVMFTPEMQPIIYDHNGSLTPDKETQEAEIILVDEYGNELA